MRSLKEFKRSVRYWDKAGTVSENAAFTAGVLMHVLQDGRFVIEHVARGRWWALEREAADQELGATATEARSRAPMRSASSRSRAAAARKLAENTIRNLRGFMVFADQVTGSKEVRADPFAAQVQGGNVALVAGSWVHPLLDEMECFPSGKYRDQVDACSGAFNRLISGYSYNLFAPGLYE